MTIRLPLLNFLLLSLLLIACGKPLPELNNIDLVRWKSDPNGCAGVRIQMTSSLQSEKKKMLGLNEMEIVDLLGKPDQQELYKRNQKFYRYYLQPGPHCSTPDSSAKKLVVRFNAVGLAKEINIE
jgi:hypothetical protein